MRDEQVKQNTTSKIITIKLRSSTTGQFVADKVAADFAGDWAIAGGTTTALSFAAGAAGDAYSSGKVCPRGDGSYDWHVPNALLTALGQVTSTISVTDCLDVCVDIQVVAVDRETAAFGANTTTPPTASAILAEFGTGSTLTDCATATGFAVAGDAMALTSSERSTLAGVIDVAILNQGDGADLIGALADAIASDWVAGDASPLAIVSAWKADATLSTMISRIDENVSATKTLTVAYDAAKTAASSTELATAQGTLDKLETALEDDGASGWQWTTLAMANAASSGSGATPETFWNYQTRTLTQSQAASQDTGSNARFNLEGGYNWQLPLTIGELGTWTALWFTLKSSPDDADDAAIASILLSNPGDGDDGLQILNAAAAVTKTQGAIAVNNSSTGELVVSLLAGANVTIPSNENRPYYWDIKKIISSGSAVKGASGVLTVATGITRTS